LFIQEGSLGVPGYFIQAGVVLFVEEFPGGWGPIDMHVEGRHKDADLEHFGVEVFRLEGAFDFHDFAVARGVKGVRLGGTGTRGVTKKVEYKPCPEEPEAA
jgi:hypothetical protein